MAHAPKPSKTTPKPTPALTPEAIRAEFLQRANALEKQADVWSARLAFCRRWGIPFLGSWFLRESVELRVTVSQLRRDAADTEVLEKRAKYRQQIHAAPQP